MAKTYTVKTTVTREDWTVIKNEFTGYSTKEIADEIAELIAEELQKKQKRGTVKTWLVEIQ